MLLSIIIPTVGRPRILQKCLDAIEAQTLFNVSSFDSALRQAQRFAPSFAHLELTARQQAGGRKGRQDDVAHTKRTQGDVLEVIIVSDGPDEKTAEMLMHLKWKFPLQHFAIPKSHQGVCRNRAVEKARGEYVLLIGDDILLAPDACEAHVRALEQHAVRSTQYAVLGNTTWDPSITITPLMRWMEESGVQFGYPKIAKYSNQFLPERIQHCYTYTSNISIPNKLLWQNKFREDVSLYGWEDIEWGMRLSDKGIPLFYESDARAFHHHAYTDDEVWERSRLLGASAVHIEQIEPAMKVVPRGFKLLYYMFISLFPTYRGRHYKAFLNGMRTKHLPSQAKKLIS